VQREHSVVGLCAHDGFAGGEQFKADQYAEKRSDAEEEEDAPEVEQTDALVVGGEYPAEDAGISGFTEKTAVAGCRGGYITHKF
jgi:hypothetical protein